MTDLSARTKLVLCLGINCTIGYGTLLYSFSLLSLEIEKELSWSSAFIYGIYSLGILLGGIAAPFLGKTLDRYGVKTPMVFGSLVMACCLYGLSTVTHQVEFIVYLLLLEILSILVLYESAFVAVVQANNVQNNHSDTKQEHKKKQAAKNETTRLSITYITLMAGFASTIFWPLIAYLLSVGNWRDVYMLMALLHFCVCLPLHYWCLRTMLPAIKTNNFIKNNRHVTNTTEDIKLTANNHTKNIHTKKEQYKTELLLALSFGGVAFCTSGLHIHLFTMMKALSIHDALAVLAGSLIGPFQVVSRVMDMFLARRITPILLGAISIVLMVCGLLFLLSASIMSSYTALLFAVFFGLGQGLTYIVRGSIPLYLFGDNHYGAITGRINGIRIIMTAIAPFSVALLLDHVEIEWVILLLSLCMAASLWLLVYLRNQQNVGVVQT